MNLRPLNIEEFTNYQKSHPLSNFYQTVNYAMAMAEDGYDYELVGMFDYNNNICAASLILLKPIGIKCFYGYAPRGFLIDYNNPELLQTFTELIKKYFYEKNVIFIKINPNIPIGILDKNNNINYNDNANIVHNLINLGYKKLADNLYFEAALPRFNAIIDLAKFDVHECSKNTKNKIRKGIRKGLTFNVANKDAINMFTNIIKNKDHNNYFYQDYFTTFAKDNDIDLFLISINYNDFLQNSQYVYDLELERNNKLNNKLTLYNNEKRINAKMASDKILLSYKNDIMEASKSIQDGIHSVIGGALVVKHNNTVSIVYSAFDKSYKRFSPNYFLHYNIIKYYKDKYQYLDLNGITGDFTINNPYHGLNRFKLGFNPNIYEFIGEFDLIIEPKSYEILLKNGILSKTFEHKEN